MTITANSGPQVNFGITLSSSGADFEHNPDRGPSVVDLGEMMMDPRQQFCFQPGAASSKPFFGWAGAFGGPVLDQSPSAVSSNNIAQTQVPVGGTALTLTAQTSRGITPGTAITAPETGQSVSGLLAIDTAMAGAAFGVSGAVNIWDPSKAVTRTLQITGSSNGSSAEAWSIAGRDLYGFKMTETVVGASITVKSQKAYKYISAIVPSTVNGAIGSTLVIVGTNDTYGFPLRVDYPAYATVWAGPSSNASLVSVSSGVHAFAVTSAASNTTGDVRGTIQSTINGGSSAANWRICMFISPSVANLLTVTSTTVVGLVGLTQFSSV